MPAVVPKLQFLDLSHYSWPVQWDQLALNPDLIAVGWKATQGQGNNDPYYKAARAEIEARGFLFCTYHFGDHSDVVGQVHHFLDVAQPGDNTRLALDWEDLRGNQMSRADAEKFCQLCDEQAGRKITVYTGNTAKDLMGTAKSEILAGHPLWIPRYSNLQPQPQASWDGQWDIWQYAADGSGPRPNTARGCSGHPDCNVFSRDVESVRANWSGKPLQAATTFLEPKPALNAPSVILPVVDITTPAGVSIRVNGKLV